MLEFNDHSLNIVLSALCKHTVTIHPHRFIALLPLANLACDMAVILKDAAMFSLCLTQGLV